MFVLSTLQDTVRVPPSNLGTAIEDVLANELNLRFANKVVLGLGLVICLNDILEVDESYLHCGDGAIFTKCKFRMIVFRPQIGEIICGTLRGSSKEGLSISLNFFDSILIPPQHLNEPSTFNEADQTWTWTFEDEGQQHPMRLDVGKQIKFRIHSEEFIDVSPHGPTAAKTKASDPYTLVGSICESGLGLVEWWN